ncbi:MAG: DUF4129 domain-containing protein [Acidobacteriota bacterium]
MIRRLLAYLISLHAAAHVSLALGSPPLPFLAFVLLVAAVWGIRDDDPHRMPDEAADRAARYRGAVGWAQYSILTVLTLLVGEQVTSDTVSAGEITLGGLALHALLAIQALFLARPQMSVQGTHVLANALVLCAVAAASGPPLATTALTGHAVLVVTWLVVDHHQRRDVPLRRAWRALLGFGLPALMLAPAIHFTPLPPRRGPAGPAPGGTGLRWSDYSDDFLQIGGWAIVGMILIWLARKLLPNREEDEGQDEQVVTAAVELQEPRLAPELEALDVSGPRGRVLKTFARVLARSEKAGRGRKPHQTALEIARRLPGPAERLAQLFGRARYGGDVEIAKTDAERAEELGGEVMKGLKRG